MRLIDKNQKPQKLAQSDKYFRNESNYSEGRVNLPFPGQDRVEMFLMNSRSRFAA